MVRTFSVERLFPLGDYKNIKLISTVTVEGDEVEAHPAVVVYDALMDEIYQAYFKHAEAISKMKSAGNDLDAQREAWDSRNNE